MGKCRKGMSIDAVGEHEASDAVGDEATCRVVPETVVWLQQAPTPARQHSRLARQQRQNNITAETAEMAATT